MSAAQQTIPITLTETTKEGLTAQIKALKLDGIETKVNNSVIFEKKQLLEKQHTEAEGLKPKNCDCGLKLDTLVTAGTAYAYP